MKIFFLITFLFSSNLIAAEKTSDQLIDEAVKENHISYNQGFLYKIRMRNNPLTVPPEYQGEVDHTKSHHLMRSIGNIIKDAEANIQQELVGFIIPPIYQGSKLFSSEEKKGPINKAFDQPIPEPFPKADWVYLENSDIRVWWQNGEHNEDNAQEILGFFPEIKEKLEKLTGKKLISDAGKHFFKDKEGHTKYWADGGNGKLDIYIGQIKEPTYLGLTVTYPESCSESASFILLEESLYGTRLKAALIHELMHVYSFTYVHGRTCKEYEDADEGIANWAINYVDPKNNFEQDYTSLIDHPGWGMATMDYRSWPFFLFMEKKFGEKSIPDILENYHLLSNWEAVNQALPGGFEKQWPLFTASQWNQIEEFDDFNDWDEWNVKPYWNELLGNSNNFEPSEVKPNEKGNFLFQKEFEIKPLATDFFHFKFSDPKIKAVVLDLLPKYETSNLLRVKVFIKKAGHLWEIEDWSKKAASTEYCKQVNDEKVEEIVIAFSNIYYPKSGEKAEGIPTVKWNFALQATNMACKSWKGSFKAEKTTDVSSGPITDIGTIELSSDANFDRFVKSDGSRANRFNVREGGNGTYRYKGTFKIENEDEKVLCTADTTGFFSIKAKTQNNGFGLNPFNASEILSRTYSGRINATIPDNITVTYNCSNNSTFTKKIIFPPAWETDIDGKNFVDSESKMLGNYSKQHQQDKFKYSWAIAPE